MTDAGIPTGTYVCAICGHTHDVRNLVLHCGHRTETRYGLLWVAPADTEPDQPSATLALSPHYLDAGVVELPDDADPADVPTRLDLTELTRTSLDLAHHGGRFHAVIDVSDGADRIRWHLRDATITPGPTPAKVTWATPWQCPLTIAVDPANVDCSVDRPLLA